MFLDDIENYDDRNYDKECEQEIINKKIQYLIKKGIAKERIRPDGTYVMTKEEFMKAVNEHYEKKKKTVFSEEEKLFMNYVFKKRKKRY